MYANATPHASATPLPGASLPHQQIGSPAELQTGQPQSMQPVPPGGHHGMQAGYVAPHPALQATPQARSAAPGTAFVSTGAYEPTGDPAIDRMIRLEAAAKRFGPAF